MVKRGAIVLANLQELCQELSMTRSHTDHLGDPLMPECDPNISNKSVPLVAMTWGGGCQESGVKPVMHTRRNYNHVEPVSNRF